jgi:hypothetical protein
MLNQYVIEKMSIEEVQEYNHLRENYWQANDECEFEADNDKAVELEKILVQQYKNMQVFEKEMRNKYKMRITVRE